MSLKMMLIVVAWLAVTFACVGLTQRLPGVKPRDARMLWSLLFAIGYAGSSLFNVYGNRLERQASQQTAQRPWKHKFSQNAVEWQSMQDLYVVDENITYTVDSPGVVFELTNLDQDVIDRTRALGRPSALAGTEVVISNGQWAAGRKAELPAKAQPPETSENGQSFVLENSIPSKDAEKDKE